MLNTRAKRRMAVDMMKENIRIIFTGGGSAGHINPALAMAGYFKHQNPTAEILYIGAKGALEEELVPQAGYEIKSITISGFQRKLTPKNVVRNVKTVANLFTSSAQVRKILKDFKPHVCVGTGGYVSGPVIREAAKAHIPCVIHDSNLYPGITTKMLSKMVKTVMIPTPETAKYFDPSVNCVVTGNPVREEVILASKESSREAMGLDERPLVLSFGGSLGAAAINSAVLDMLKESVKEKKYQHLHGYGSHDDDFMERAKAAVSLEENPQVTLKPYISNMNEAMSAADIVICRAGAITLSELEAKAKAAILIPSPNVAENHQYHNAMALKKNGAAEVITEDSLSGEMLWKMITGIFETPGKIDDLEKNAKKMGVGDADSRIYDVIMSALKDSEIRNDEQNADENIGMEIDEDTKEIANEETTNEAEQSEAKPLKAQND